MSNEDKRRAELLQRLARLQWKTREIESELEGKRAGWNPFPPFAESTLASLISHHSSDLVSIHTIQGDYLYASSSAKRFLGVSPEEVVGRSAYDFFHHADVEQIATMHARHLDSDAEDLTVRYRLESEKGVVRWVESHTRVTPDGEMLVIITKNIDEDLVDVEPDSGGSKEDAVPPESKDELTKLPNRLILKGTLEKELDRAQRKGHHLSVAKFDIDHFTRIDDFAGREEATRVLRNIGFLLRRNQRIYDTLGRWGRDEFLLLLPETTIDEARVAAERYRQTIEGAHLVSSGSPVTISAGLAMSGETDRTDDLLQHVDMALSLAKEAGRNRVAPYSDH